MKGDLTSLMFLTNATIDMIFTHAPNPYPHLQNMSAPSAIQWILDTTQIRNWEHQNTHVCCKEICQ